MTTGKPSVSIHWFRRDLRISDNHGLYRALTGEGNVLGVFIFDTEILSKLEERKDRRVHFIHKAVSRLKALLEQHGSSLHVCSGSPERVWKELMERYTVLSVTANHDHEPYAVDRDARVGSLLRDHGIPFTTYKDSSIFERSEVMKDDGGAYTVFTPYARKWKSLFTPAMAHGHPSERHLDALWGTSPLPMPSLASIGFGPTDLDIPPVKVNEDILRHYGRTRDIPGLDGTSRMSMHLRFGTVSVRGLVRKAMELNQVYLNELIWREFFMQILWNFPHVEKSAFKPAYEHIAWRNDEQAFKAWCEGRTGYPLVDAGMRELNATGLMHNRVRMVTASFLCKHLLTDWRWGEAYFAEKLLDFELSSNNGNWQWASGSGCDAAPWFRIFNPTLQMERFDPQLTYVKRWVPEYGGTNYARPIVVHTVARTAAIAAYKQGLEAARS